MSDKTIAIILGCFLCTDLYATMHVAYWAAMQGGAFYVTMTICGTALLTFGSLALVGYADRMDKQG